MKWINLIFYILMVGVNAFANIFKLGGKNTGEISANYPNVLTPAAYTFAIWGVIYLMLLLFVIAPFVRPDGKVAEVAIRLKGWFAVSCVFNIAWIIMWHFEKIGWSVAVMAALLGTLFVMYAKYTYLGSEIFRDNPSAGTFGLSVYLAWIFVAMLANVMVLLVSIGIDGFGTWAQIISALMLIAGAVVLTLIGVSGNWILPITGMWAYAGILIRQLSPQMLDGKYGSIILCTILGMGIMLFAIVVGVMNINGAFSAGKELTEGV